MAYQPLSSFIPSGVDFGNSPSSTKPPASPGLYGSSTTQSSTPAYRLSPMGAPAVSPQHNETPKVNTIPSKQVQPPVQPSATNPPPTPTPQPQTQTAGAINSFPGLMGSLANTAVNGTPQYSQANDNFQKASSDEQKFREMYANEQAKIGTEFNPFGFETGVGQLAANRYSQLLPAYEQRVTNAATGVTNSLTGQGQRLTGLYNAAGLAAPQQVPLTSQPFYPVEGQFSGAGGGVGTRATQAANVSSLGDLVSKSNNYHALFGGIDNIQKQLTGFLGVKDLNPTTFPYVNQAISTILTKGLGDPNYQQLNNYMSDLASRYAVYFGNDAAPTNQVRNVASALVNGNARPEDIMQVIQGLGSQASGVMQGVDDQIKYIQSNPTGINAQQGSQAQQQPSGGGLYDF